MVNGLFKFSTIRKTLGRLWQIRSRTAYNRKIVTPDVFVSYSWKDSDLVVPFVELLMEFLSPKGIQVFFDRDSRPLDDPGALNTGLASGLSTAQIFLPCPSRNYIDSKWCSKETSAFLWRFISENSAAKENKQDPGCRLAASPQLCCLPVIVGCDDSHEAISEFEKWEFALLRESRQNSIGIEDIREFIRSSKSLAYRAGQKPGEFSEDVGSTIVELLADSAEEKREFSPIDLWKMLWKRSIYREIGERVDPVALLEGFSITADVLKKAGPGIASFADEGLVELFVSIAKGRSECTAFDRLSSVTSTGQGGDHLQASSMVGDPVVLLFSKAKNHPMLQELQYSYYAFISQYGHDELVDVCALACLSMNLSWYEGVRTAEDMRKYVLTPLSKGVDIIRHVFM